MSANCTTLTTAEALAAGYRVRKNRGAPRIVSPDGKTEFVRCVFGKPSLAIVGPTGTTTLYQSVAFRSGDSLLRLCRVPRGPRA